MNGQSSIQVPHHSAEAYRCPPKRQQNTQRDHSLILVTGQLQSERAHPGVGPLGQKLIHFHQHLVQEAGFDRDEPNDRAQKNEKREKGQQEVETQSGGHSPAIVTTDLLPQSEPELPLGEIIEGLQI